MPEVIALKYLQSSDLTLFHSIWLRDNQWFRDGQIKQVSKQKAINLNAREFLDGMYPAVRAAAKFGNTRLPLALTIYGPGGAGAHEVARKAVRSPGAKNWRLNGETIHAPDGDPTRYERLVPGDIALLKFSGEPTPQAVTMALLSAGSGDDATIRELMRDMDDTGMVLITPLRLAEALKAAGVPRDRPAWLLAQDEELEDAMERAFEGDPGALDEVKRRRRRAGGGASLEQYLRARAAAEETGRAGEEAVAGWLDNACGHFEWVSGREPLSPFDMLAEGGPLGLELTYLDVKSTKRGFGERFHLSMGEATFAAEADAPYRIVRAYDVGADDAPRVRISDPINAFAGRLLASHDGALPNGVQADGFVVAPDADGLGWGDAIELPGDDEAA